MEINGIEIKPGMVIETRDSEIYVAVSRKDGITLVNITKSRYTHYIPDEFLYLSNISSTHQGFCSGEILTKRKVTCLADFE